MTVKTTRVGQRYTTTRLTLPLAYQPLARAIAGGVVAGLVLFAFGLDAIERRQAQPIQEAQPLIERPNVVFIVATPTPQPLPTPAQPVLMAAPPTAAPAVVYQTVEVPVYVEVQSAPAAEPAQEWHPPEVVPTDMCATWRPPLAYPEECQAAERKAERDQERRVMQSADK